MSVDCLSCYTVAEVAERLKVTAKTVYRLVWSGSLRSIKVGGAVRVTHDALSRYLDGAARVAPVAERPAGRKARKPRSTKLEYRFFPPPS